MLHSSIRLIETFGLVQTMQSLLSVVKKQTVQKIKVENHEYNQNQYFENKYHCGVMTVPVIPPCPNTHLKYE